MAARHVPTLKERKFVRKAIETGSLKLAADYAYNTKDPHRMVRDVMKRPHVKLLFEKMIDDNKVIQTLHDQLDATSFTKDFGEVPDNQARLKAVDISLKVKGAYPADQKFNIGGQSINFIITKAESPARSEEYEGEVVDGNEGD